MRAGSESYLSLSLPMCFHAPVVSSTVQLCSGSLSVCSDHFPPPLPHLHLHPPTQHTLSASHFHARLHSNLRVHPAPAPISIQSHRPAAAPLVRSPDTHVPRFSPRHHRTITRLVPWPHVHLIQHIALASRRHSTAADLKYAEMRRLFGSVSIRRCGAK